MMMVMMMAMRMMMIPRQFPASVVCGHKGDPFAFALIALTLVGINSNTKSFLLMLGHCWQNIVLFLVKSFSRSITSNATKCRELQKTFRKSREFPIGTKEKEFRSAQNSSPRKIPPFLLSDASVRSRSSRRSWPFSIQMKFQQFSRTQRIFQRQIWWNFPEEKIWGATQLDGGEVH